MNVMTSARCARDPSTRICLSWAHGLRSLLLVIARKELIDKRYRYLTREEGEATVKALEACPVDAINFNHWPNPVIPHVVGDDFVVLDDGDMKVVCLDGEGGRADFEVYLEVLTAKAFARFLSINLRNYPHD